MYYVVYFLESIKYPQKHYIGVTTDIKKRITAHNNSNVISTKKFKPWKLVYAELYTNKEDASGREKFLKSGSGWKYLNKQLKNYFNNKNHAHFTQKKTG
jgi:predicted GIY-YIG superfamily endonuclease